MTDQAKSGSVTNWKKLGVLHCQRCNLKTNDAGLFQAHNCKPLSYIGNKAFIIYKSETNKFFCSLCTIDLLQEKFEEHLENHVSLKPYICKYCKLSCNYQAKEIHPCHSKHHEPFELNISMQTKKIILTAQQNQDKKEYYLPLNKSFRSDLKSVAASESCITIQSKSTATASLPSIIRTSDNVHSSTAPVNSSIDLLKGPCLTNPVVHDRSLNPVINQPINLANHQPLNPLTHMPMIPIPLFYQNKNMLNHQPMTFPQNYHVQVAPSFNTTNSYSYVNPIMSPSTHILKQTLLINNPGTGLSNSPESFFWHKPSTENQQQKPGNSHLNIQEILAVSSNIALTTQSKFEQNADFHKSASLISLPENCEDSSITHKPNNIVEKDDYSYLLLIKGLFLCLKCKKKWSDNYNSFFMHIWKQHSHDDNNFTCCPDGFSLKCERLKKVLKSVYRKSPESMPDVLKHHLLIFSDTNQQDSIASETVSLSHSHIEKTHKKTYDEMISPTTGQTSYQNVTEEITRMNICSNEYKSTNLEILFNETTLSIKKEVLKMNTNMCDISYVDNRNTPSLSNHATEKRSETNDRNNRYSVDNMETLDVNSVINSAYYQCGFQDCTYASIQPVDLLSHTEEIHGAETNFPCIYCGYLGATSSTLLDHLGEHIGSEDGKVFSGSLLQNSSSVFNFEAKDINSIIGRFEEKLKDYTNTANLGFLCNTCKTKFYTLKELRDHLIKSLLKVVSCKHCRSCFLDTISWQRHRAKQHPNEPRLYYINRKLLCDSIKKNINQFKSDISRFKRLYSLDKQNQCATNMEDTAESKLRLPIVPNIEKNHSVKSVDNSTTPSYDSDSLSVHEMDDTIINPGDLLESHKVSSPLQLANDDTNNNVVSATENTSFLPEVLNLLENSDAQKIVIEQNKNMSKDVNQREMNILSIKTVTSNVAGRSSGVILDDVVDENNAMRHLQITSCNKNPLESNFTFMRLLSEICGETNTDLLLKPLYDNLEQNRFSCKRCKLIVSTLKRLHGHLFHCIGKMGLVHCPHCGYQGEHSKYIVHHIQKQHPGENCKLLIYLNVNIPGLMQTLQTSTVNIDTFADLCSKFKSGGGSEKEHQIDVVKNKESLNLHSAVINEPLVNTTELLHQEIIAIKCGKNLIDSEPMLCVESENLTEVDQSLKLKHSSLQKKPSNTPIKKRRLSSGEEESTTQRKQRSAFSNLKHGKFNSDGSLEPNVRRSGLKPGAKRTALNRYQCRLGCTFICKWNESSMINHLKINHPYYSCGYCGAVYFIKEQLENHFKFVHRGLEPFKVNSIAVADFFKLVKSQIVNENEINMDKRFKTNKLSNSEDKISMSSKEDNSKAINVTVDKESDKSVLKQKLKDRLAKKCGLVKKPESKSFKDYPFKCTVCRSSRKSVSDILDHFRWLHADKEVMFVDRKYCHIYSSTGEIVSSKLGTTTPSLDHLCYFCTYRHHMKSFVETHIKAKHSGNEIKVFSPHLPESRKTDECKNIDTEKNLISSTAITTPVTSTSYRCSKCDDLLTSQFAFRLHLGKHEGFKYSTILTSTAGLLICSICGYVANSHGDLGHHTEKHMNERQYYCSLCDFDSHTKSGVWYHIKRVHGFQKVEIINRKKQSKKLKLALVNLDPKVLIVNSLDAEYPNYLRDLLLKNGIKMLDIEGEYICANILQYNNNEYFEVKAVDKD